MSQLVFDHPVSLHRLWPQPVEGTIIDRMEWEGISFALFEPKATQQKSWRLLCPTNPIKCRSVTMTRLEGPTKLCDVPKICEGYHLEWKGETTWINAIQVASTEFLSWGNSAPSNGAYDKCSTTTLWENGESFSFRFDLQWGGVSGDYSFRDTLTRKMFYWAGLYRPGHMRETEYLRDLEVGAKLGFVSLSRSVLTHCEL